MRAIKMAALGLLLLPVAEFVAFVLVAHAIGFVAALLLLILISLSGIHVLRQAGSGGVSELRTAGGYARISTVNLDGGGAARALGGILMVIPGFITGVLGIIVVFRPSRQWLLAALAHLLPTGERRAEPRTIDLDPDEWQRLPSPRQPRRSRRSA
jgi:UPF0716 protein FxsA